MQFLFHLESFLSHDGCLLAATRVHFGQSFFCDDFVRCTYVELRRSDSGSNDEFSSQLLTSSTMENREKS
ncbi:uncharacterized protein PHALS_14805 [Plasmopara halstedii]|uniref:Uncharacterized protein n=1 Tax=Plasmopara halstedii TaxID=4781 RepID=A0A0P1AWH4_PLAHL|nr:uncharacterized protein PHALS_14805 [Plasmopara halstedii]CEG45378.1 hypothetical protein PHALS_14805 [Plasmopara halstedii]|eukprot:XP_024581747.1 hypothetical protein PHALS_14805 [Plasmopara halstedii]